MHTYISSGKREGEDSVSKIRHLQRTWPSDCCIRARSNTCVQCNYSNGVSVPHLLVSLDQAPLLDNNYYTAKNTRARTDTPCSESTGEAVCEKDRLSARPHAV